MSEQEIQQLQKTISTLKELLKSGENYADVEDVIAIAKASRKAIDEIREDVEKLDSDVSRKLAKVVDDFSREMEKHEAKNSKKHAECMKMIDSMEEKMEIMKADLLKDLPSMNLMTERHNDMEFELSQMDSKISANVNQTKEELLDELRQVESKLSEEIKKGISTRSTGSRRVYQPYVERFTSQTDGVTKTFYLKREPLKTDTIEVSGTDFPIILDPTVDFSVSGKAVTLSAAVPAPSQGATLIIKYYA